MSSNNNIDIIIETKELVHALALANLVVEKKSTVNELNNIKLAIKDGFLELIATDMDMMLSQKIGANVIGEGETTVSVLLLTDITRKIPDREINLRQTEGSQHLEIIGKNCNFSLLTLPVSQFPTMENINASTSLKILCKDFAKLIDYTQFAMSLEETRYNLNGIYLHTAKGEFKAAATDGHRLSVAQVPLATSGQDFGVILPRKAVQEIAKIVKDVKHMHAEIEVLLSVNKIKFACNNIVMISKLIDGTFPDYSSFIPVNNPHKFTVNSKYLNDVIERVSTVTIDKFRAVKMILNKSQIEITASGEARGVAKEVLKPSHEQDNLCWFTSDEEVTIGFNPRYLLDVLGTMKDKQVELYIKDSYSPALIKTTTSLNDNFVIMPIKV